MQELSIDQIWEQFRRTRDDHFRNLLMEHYRNLVRYCAERLHSKLPDKVELDDLVSAGIFGLMDAIDAFDPDRGVKFETYCSPRIRGSILDELRSMDWVSRLVRARASQLSKAQKSLEAHLGRKPTEKEIAKELDMNTEEFKRLQRDANAVSLVSLDTKYGDGDGEKDIREIDIIKDERSKNPVIEAQKRDLKSLLTKGMTRAERLIIVLYYYEEMTFKGIAATLQLSETRIAQMHSSIIARLKAQMNSRKKEFAIGAEKKKQWPREQHYLFAHETMKDLFLKEPKRVIDKLKDNRWKEYLLEIWDKAGKNLEKFCFVAPDGLSREIRIREDNTVIALITLPKPQVISEAYFIALLCRPCEKNFSSKQKIIPHFLLLEYSVPCGYGNLNTALKEWTEKGVHNIGYGCEPTLEAFYEAVCNILDEPTRNS